MVDKIIVNRSNEAELDQAIDDLEERGWELVYRKDDEETFYDRFHVNERGRKQHNGVYAQNKCSAQMQRKNPDE